MKRRSSGHGQVALGVLARLGCQCHTRRGCYRSPGVHAVVVLRFGQWLLRRRAFIRFLLTPPYTLLSQRIRSKWGIEILRSAQIDEGLYIGHYGGITTSHRAVVGGAAYDITAVNSDAQGAITELLVQEVTT